MSNKNGVTKIIIDKCSECERVFTDEENVGAIEATGCCLECVWLQEGMTMETNNDGEKRQREAARL